MQIPMLFTMTKVNDNSNDDSADHGISMSVDIIVSVQQSFVFIFTQSFDPCSEQQIDWDQWTNDPSFPYTIQQILGTMGL